MTKLGWLEAILGLAGLTFGGIMAADCIQQEKQLKKQSEEINNAINKATDDLYKNMQLLDANEYNIKINKDINRLFNESIENARSAGVPENEIIKTPEEGEKYFTE